MGNGREGGGPVYSPAASTRLNYMLRDRASPPPPPPSERAQSTENLNFLPRRLMFTERAQPQQALGAPAHARPKCRQICRPQSSARHSPPE